MTTYVYRCDACGLTFERRQRMTDARLTDCPQCGGHIHRVIQPVPIVFKGSGFYVTDHRQTGSTTSVPGDGQKPRRSTEKAEQEKEDSEASSST